MCPCQTLLGPRSKEGTKQTLPYPYETYYLGIFTQIHSCFLKSLFQIQSNIFSKITSPHHRVWIHISAADPVSVTPGTSLYFITILGVVGVHHQPCVSLKCQGTVHILPQTRAGVVEGGGWPLATGLQHCWRCTRLSCLPSSFPPNLKCKQSNYF